MPARKNHKAKKKHHQQPQHQLHQKQPQEQELPQSQDEETTPPAYRIAHSDIYGRYLVANRELKPGELLITEPPLVIGPCVSADPVCLGCYKPVTLSAAQYRCPSCAWPLCGPSCVGLGQSNGHSTEECALYTKRRPQAADQLHQRAAPIDIRDLYELVVIVRILLLRTHAPAQYVLIERMESHTEERRHNAVLWQHYEEKVVHRLRESWQLSETISADELHQICGILDVNCFEIGQNGAKARTLYPSAFLLAHDCSPNTAHTDDPRSFAIYLRTSRRVREHEALTLSYAYTLQGTLKRRDFMHDGKLFWCQCQRCADPRELGTDCSALICGGCKAGTVRAAKPLDQDADWTCDRCDYRLSATQLVRLLDRINNDLESIDVHDIPGLENFLKRYREILRPNHYLLLSAKYSLCQIYGRIEGYLLPQMSLEDIERKERYCREFLEVIDVLEPGLTRLRGLIMYELHAPIMVLAQHAIQNGQIQRQDFQRKLKEVVKMLRESRDILLLEPEGSSEHEMGLAAADALTKMGC
ncbi:SET domain-containing protein SmydA-8 [Scaptodrosophila lebanonensis]|uniref:SET domain-containing protein SmydA-8 n=1 Tax=Drosophila lebanonensis TaxID=7225 RepID=A0A6J2TTG8_DROLE|nr:SET domain-containing protein SmydA-8 [Scaptodrosophila lebanonensis]